MFGKSSAPGSEAVGDKWLLPQKVKFLEKNLPQAAKLPGTSGSFQISHNSGKSFAPGSEAAWDKLLLPKKVKFLEKVLPQAAKLPGTSGLFKKKKKYDC